MPSVKSFTIAQIKSLTFRFPLVSRRKHDLALDALEKANQENRNSVRAMFDISQTAERRRLLDLKHVYELFLGSPWSFGGLDLTYRTHVTDKNVGL